MQFSLKILGIRKVGYIHKDRDAEKGAQGVSLIANAAGINITIMKIGIIATVQGSPYCQYQLAHQYEKINNIVKNSQ